MSNLPRKKIGVAVIVNEEGQILIDKRLDKGSMANKWEFPGGKFEEGETAIACITREIKEELGIMIEVDDHLMDLNYDYPQFSLTLSVYYAHIISGEPRTVECAEIRWVEAKDLSNFEFPSANQKIIEAINQK